MSPASPPRRPGTDVGQAGARQSGVGQSGVGQSGVGQSRVGGTEVGRTEVGRTVVVVGAAGEVGRRLLARLEAETSVEAVVAVDRRARRGRDESSRTTWVQGDITTLDLATIFQGADAVVHLAWSLPPPTVLSPRSVNLELTGRVLDAVSAASVPLLVHLSSATVYGAWADNPRPLSEDAPVRPNPGFVYAEEKADVERLVVGWRGEHPAVAVAVLRPTVVLGARSEGWLPGALGAGRRPRPDENERGVQFVHVDDVGAAIVLALAGRLDGTFNVAPGGWVSSDTARALAGGLPRIRLPSRFPARLVASAAGWAWRLHLSDVPPATHPYTEHSWVLSSDRLRALGWRPMSSEEAVVTARPASRWSTLSPGRRQQLALGGSLVALLALVGGLVAVVRSLRRPR